MVIVLIKFTLFLILRVIDWLFYPGSDSDWDCLHGREPDPLKREVYTPGYGWGTFPNAKTGDIDVLPLGEEHQRGTGCPCSPRVDVEGARLVISHNAYDHREIVEEAIRVMNGVE